MIVKSLRFDIKLMAPLLIYLVGWMVILTVVFPFNENEMLDKSIIVGEIENSVEENYSLQEFNKSYFHFVQTTDDVYFMMYAEKVPFFKRYRLHQPYDLGINDEFTASNNFNKITIRIKDSKPEFSSEYGVQVSYGLFILTHILIIISIIIRFREYYMNRKESMLNQ